MRRLLQKILRPFFIWLAEKFSAAPTQAAVFKSLSGLYESIITKNNSRGIVVDINTGSDKFIIFSDQHKGTKNFNDDFVNNEINFTAALQYYYQEGFSFINLGDAEELWKNTADNVLAAYPAALMAEANFHTIKKYYRTFGNHDVLWKNSLDVTLYFKNMFELPLPVYEGMVLRVLNAGYAPVDIFCTHGHQGDKMSDNNAVSTWVIAHIWAPLQRFIQVNVNTPANDFTLRNKHNRLMYEWSSRNKNIMLVTGHTHKPVFASGKYAGTPVHQINTPGTSNEIKPSYFNTGCCCFNDGDITGLEIGGDYLRLIKWHNKKGVPERSVLEEKMFKELLNDL